MSSLSLQQERQPADGSAYRTIANLIEDAAASCELDPDSSRDNLFRAAALLRSRNAIRRESTDRSRELLTRAGLLGWQVSRIVDHVDSSLAAAIRISDLAELVGVSVSQLFKSFKVSVGMSPSQYIAQRRVENACKMLRTTTRNLREIAAVCGFRDHTQFSRAFRRMVGQTPSCWRRANSMAPC